MRGEAGESLPVCIWESSREPRSLDLSGFEWLFLRYMAGCLCVFVSLFILLVCFRDMWG